MKQYSTNSCGYKLNFNGPDTVEEYDKRAGTVGQCLEDAVNNTIYRGTLPEWQEEFASVLEKQTGIKRETDKEATAKLKSRAKNPDNVGPQPEKFRAYNARVKGIWGNGDTTKEAQLQTWAQETADKIPVDPAPSVRQSTATKGDLAKVDDILAKDTDYIEAKVAKMLAIVPDFELQRDEENKPERLSLARLLGKWVEAEMLS
jgi:hypothetical protein